MMPGIEYNLFHSRNGYLSFVRRVHCGERPLVHRSAFLFLNRVGARQNSLQESHHIYAADLFSGRCPASTKTALNTGSHQGMLLPYRPPHPVDRQYLSVCLRHRCVYCLEHCQPHAVGTKHKGFTLAVVFLERK